MPHPRAVFLEALRKNAQQSSKQEEEEDDDSIIGLSEEEKLQRKAFDVLLNSDDSDEDPTYTITQDTDSSDEEDEESVHVDNEDQQIVSEILHSTINNVVESVDKGEKRKKTRLDRLERKKLKNSGKTYFSESGKVIKSRVMGDLQNCRMECSKRLSYENRKIIFDLYWSLGSRDLRAHFVSSNVAIMGTKTKKTQPKTKNKNISCSYFFIITGQKYNVCQKCFISTLGETRGFIEYVIKKKQLTPCSMLVAADQRGRAPPAHKRSDAEIEEVNNHILSFPSYESHYCRQTSSKKYLSSDLNISKMYKLYAENRENPVSLNFYAACFHKLNLSFKKPKKDTCYTCDLFHAQIESAAIEDKASIIKMKDAHQILADSAYASKREDKEHAKKNSNHRVFAFDLQQCLPTPFLKTSVAFYRRQLWTFNLTVHDLANDKGHCFIWDESVSGRGANQIASCLFEFLKSLPPDTETVTFYSDTCGGQNKNNIVASMFLYALHTLKSIKEVNHKFLVSGHTHMECDSDHAVIEKAKKNTNLKINHPNDWVQLVRLAKQKNSFNVVTMTSDKFLDFNSLLKKGGPYMVKKTNSKNEKFLWKPIQWLQYRSTELSGTANIFFKHSLEKNDIFQLVNFRRKGKNAVPSTLPLVSAFPNPISKEKKRDLLALIELIDPAFHDFYKNLVTNDETPTDPDLIEINVDDD